MALAGLGVHLVHGVVFPETVDPGAHQVVHQVVARGDLVEHVIDEGLLPAERDRGETEMGFV